MHTINIDIMIAQESIMYIPSPPPPLPNCKLTITCSGKRASLPTKHVRGAPPSVMGWSCVFDLSYDRPGLLSLWDEADVPHRESHRKTKTLCCSLCRLYYLVCLPSTCCHSLVRSNPRPPLHESTHHHPAL